MHFRKQGLSVPEVFCHNKDFSCYLQQDLGDVTLYNAVETGRSKGSYDVKEKALLHKAMEALPALQFKGADKLDFSVCYPQPDFDARMVSFDLNYFKYCFLKATGLEFSEIQLENDFQKLSEILLHNASETFLYRDFQARNVMLVNGEYFIDFQRAKARILRRASFVWQAGPITWKNSKRN